MVASSKGARRRDRRYGDAIGSREGVREAAQHVPEGGSEDAAHVLLLAGRQREVDGLPHQGRLRGDEGEAGRGCGLLLQIEQADVPRRVEREVHAVGEGLPDGIDQEQQPDVAEGIRGRVRSQEEVGPPANERTGTFTCTSTSTCTEETRSERLHQAPVAPASRPPRRGSTSSSSTPTALRWSSTLWPRRFAFPAD